MLWNNSLLKKTLLSKFHSGWKSPQKDSFYKIASEASKGCLNVLVKNMHQNLPFLARKIKYGTFWVIFKQCDLSSHFRYAQGKLTFGTFFYFYGESDRLTNFFQASMGFLMHWLQLLKWASKQKCTSFSYPTRNCSLFTVFRQLINVGSISFKQADAFVFTFEVDQLVTFDRSLSLSKTMHTGWKSPKEVSFFNVASEVSARFIERTPFQAHALLRSKCCKMRLFEWF